MTNQIKAQTSVLFPNIVSRIDYGNIAENEYLYNKISSLRNDKSIANKCEQSDTTTFTGYQPDIVLTEYFKDDPMWQSFMNKVVGPSLNAHANAHRQIAGFPVADSRFDIKSSWAVIYPANAYQAPHFHRDVSCVFTYYVKVPQRPAPENAITFINPNLASTYPALKSFSYDHTYIPKTGTNLIFPGSMQHYAHPHFGGEEKMIIVFDIKFEPPANYQRPSNRYQ